jgi:hypothetical protein
VAAYIPVKSPGPPTSIRGDGPPTSFGGADPGRARAQGAVSVSLPQVTHFSNSAPVSGSAAFAQRWAPTRHKNRSNVLIPASCSRDQRHAHTQQHSRPKGPRTAGPRPSPRQHRSSNGLANSRSAGPPLRPAPLMKLFTGPGSPDHTQFYPRANPHSVTTDPRTGRDCVGPSV